MQSQQSLSKIKQDLEYAKQYLEFIMSRKGVEIGKKKLIKTERKYKIVGQLV